MVARDPEHDAGRLLRPVVVRAHRVVDERGLHLAVLRRAARRDGVAAPLGAGDDQRLAGLGCTGTRPGRGPCAARAAGHVARGPRGRLGADEARAQPAGGAAEAELEDVGRAGVGGLGAGGGVAAVGRVVAGGVQRQPRRPGAAPLAGADLRLEAPAALPAQPHQVEAPRRVEHLRRAPATRGVGAVVGERELEQRRPGSERGAGAEDPAGDGGGTETEGLPAVEAAADHAGSEHGIAQKGPVRLPTNAILQRLDERQSPRRTGGGSAP